MVYNSNQFTAFECLDRENTSSGDESAFDTSNFGRYRFPKS